MGLRIPGFGRKSDDCSASYTPTTQTAPNPNPYRFKVIHIEIVNNGVVVVAKYPDCTTHAGQKLLVYRKEAFNKIVNKMDPHFLEDDTSPFARFEPTALGLAMAVLVASRL